MTRRTQRVRRPKPPPPAIVPALLSPAQAATYLALSRNSIYNLMRDGKLASVKIGGARRIERVELDRLIRDSRDPKPPQR